MRPVGTALCARRYEGRAALGGIEPELYMAIRSAAALAVPILFVQHVLGQACTPNWSNEFAGDGIGRADPVCAAIFDEDGPGPQPPALFVGGWFTRAGGQI